MSDDVTLLPEDDEGPYRAEIGIEAPAAIADEPEKPTEEPPKPADGTEDRVRDLQDLIAAQRAVIEQQRKTPAPLPPVAAPRPTVPDIDISEDRINELYVSNPARATALLLAKAQAEQERNAAHRQQSMLNNMIASAYTSAQQRHADDFTEFGDQIMAVVNTVNPEILADPTQWDNIVRLVRGNNIDKIVDRTLKKRESEALATARAAEAAKAASATAAASTRRGGASVATPTKDNNYGLTAREMEIARSGGLTNKEYAEYKLAARGGR